MDLDQIQARLGLVQENDPQRKGQLASQKVMFGKCGRYAVAAVHTRFGAVSYFVWDADCYADESGTPDVVRQEDSLEAALEGLL